jgi:hypothetical protein
MVWWPGPEWVEGLKFRLAFQNKAVVREAFQGWRGQYYTLGPSGDPATAPGGVPAPPTNFVEARAELLRRLAEDRREGGASEGTRAAARTYDTWVWHDLVAPLVALARMQRDPLLMNAMAELANVSGLLHRLSPTLHDLQSRALDGARARGRGEEDTHALFLQHGQLSVRLAALLKIVCQLRKASS